MEPERTIEMFRNCFPSAVGVWVKSGTIYATFRPKDPVHRRGAVSFMGMLVSLTKVGVTLEEQV